MVADATGLTFVDALPRLGYLTAARGDTSPQSWRYNGIRSTLKASTQKGNYVLHIYNPHGNGLLGRLPMRAA